MTLMHTLARSSAMHAAFAATLLGGWAVYANSGHPMPAPLIAGIVQGALSAVIAVGQKAIMERVHARTQTLPPPILASVTFSLIVIVVLHTLARTPELLATISLPWTIGLIYSTLYTLTLHRTALQRPRP